MKIITDIVATALEIGSFFLVTSDLFGRERMQRLAERLRSSTQRRFARFRRVNITKMSLNNVVLLSFAAVTMGGFILFSMAQGLSDEPLDFSVYLPHGKFYEHFWGQGDEWHGWPIYILLLIIYYFVIPLTGLLFWFFPLYMLVMGLYYLSVLLFFQTSRLLFWRPVPEGGYLVAGSVLFVLSKLITLVASL